MFCTNCGKEIANNAVVCTSCGVAVGTEKKFCANCGQPVKPNQAICIGCGCSLQGGAVGNNAQGGSKKVQPSGKSASTATILSCLIVGLGQIYLGQVVKGIVMLVGAMVLGSITMGALALPIWIIAMVDANRIGKKLEAGQSVGEWEFF